jgi:hypothetical protein
MSWSGAGEPSDPHPGQDLLERFMRNEVSATERRQVVRHLLAGCARCVAVTRELWALGKPDARARRSGLAAAGLAAPGLTAAPPVPAALTPTAPSPGSVTQGGPAAGAVKLDLFADLAADHGDPDDADRQLTRAVELYRAACGAPGAAQGAALDEALSAAVRAQTLFHQLALPAAAADARRLQGQIEAALGRPADAEDSLSAAAAALARHGVGRGAALAQVQLGLLLARQGRTEDLRRLGLAARPPLFAGDAAWGWTAALLVFQRQADAAPDDAATLQALAHYLASPPAAHRRSGPASAGSTWSAGVC